MAIFFGIMAFIEFIELCVGIEACSDVMKITGSQIPFVEILSLLLQILRIVAWICLAVMSSRIKELKNRQDGHYFMIVEKDEETNKRIINKEKVLEDKISALQKQLNEAEGKISILEKMRNENAGKNTSGDNG
ncbi:MAG: hypothetical protein IJR61_07815 [Clostridia bacterium]|nr:hypothetical protein [Clostridia bacterium]